MQTPHPGSFLKAPMPLPKGEGRVNLILSPLPRGEGGHRPGEGPVADRAALLGALRSLATDSHHSRVFVLSDR